MGQGLLSQATKMGYFNRIVSYKLEVDDCGYAYQTGIIRLNS